MQLLPKPTESELELLRILWTIEPATVRDIYEALNRERASGYTTILKMLQIMTAKGRAVSEPMPCEKAAGTRPMIATPLETKILRHFSFKAAHGSPKCRHSAINIMPVKNETPTSTIPPAAAEILKFKPVSLRAPSPPNKENGISQRSKPTTVQLSNQVMSKTIIAIKQSGTMIISC